MREYRTLSTSEFADGLLCAKSPVIAIHTRPDGDAVGTAVSLFNFYKQRGLSAKIVCDMKVTDHLSFLTEGVTCVTDVTAEDGTVFSVDVASPSQLGDNEEPLSHGEKVFMMLDHHAVGTPFADHLIMPEKSSAGEVLLEVYRELISRGEMTMTRDIAYPLFAAICSDTGCFRFSNATPKTLRACADLLEVGIDGADICHRLFDSKSQNVIRAEGLTAGKIIAEPDGISYAVITKEDRDGAGLMIYDFETAIDVVRSLRGTQIAFVVKENDKKEYKVSLRSTGDNVAVVAERFGGGGHVRAAGCSVSADSAESAVKTLLSVIRELRK